MGNLKAIIVEKETVVALDILNNLEKWGYTITDLVATGEEAVQSARKNRPDFILMDSDMTGQSDCSQAVKMIQDSVGVPVILLTSKTDSCYTSPAKLEEPYKFVIKPFRARDLQLAIRMTLHHQRLEDELREGREKYRKLADFLDNGILELDQKGRVVYANQGFCRLSKFGREDVLGQPVERFLDGAGKKQIKKVLDSGSEASPRPREICVVGKGGKRLKVQHATQPLEGAGNGHRARGFLMILNPYQRDTVAEAADAQSSQRQNEQEEVERIRLEEFNKSLRSLLDKRETENRMIKKQVMANVRELVLPYVRKLRHTDLGGRQSAYIDILEFNLNELVSPFARVLSTRDFNLTPSEMQIANLVKQGKSTKYIADLLDLSRRTVESHRRNIRIKLGLKNKKANMRSFLSSLD